MICYNSDGLIVWKIVETEDRLRSMLGDCPQAISDDRNQSHRLQSMVVSIIVKDLFGDVICHQNSGRPYLKKSAVNISISHTNNYVAIQYGPSRVGIDIELLSRNASKVIKRVSTENELTISRKLFPQNPELLLWCLKESAYKFSLNQPVGLGLGFQTLCFADSKERLATVTTSDGNYNFSYMVLDDLLVVYSL